MIHYFAAAEQELRQTQPPSSSVELSVSASLRQLVPASAHDGSHSSVSERKVQRLDNYENNEMSVPKLIKLQIVCFSALF